MGDMSGLTDKKVKVGHDLWGYEQIQSYALTES